MLCFLMLMQVDFIFECFITIEAEWLQIRQISIFSSHLININAQLLKFILV